MERRNADGLPLRNLPLTLVTTFYTSPLSSLVRSMNQNCLADGRTNVSNHGSDISNPQSDIHDNIKITHTSLYYRIQPIMYHLDPMVRANPITEKVTVSKSFLVSWACWEFRDSSFLASTRWVRVISLRLKLPCCDVVARDCCGRLRSRPWTNILL